MKKSGGGLRANNTRCSSKRWQEHEHEQHEQQQASGAFGGDPHMA